MSTRLAVNMQPADREVAKSIAIHWTQSGLFASQKLGSDSALSPPTLLRPASDNVETSVQEKPANNSLFADISARSPR